jgi:hypothetical protein
MKRLFPILLFLIAACATDSHRKGYPPLLEEAQALRGHSFEEVKKALGSPADSEPNGRVFWFLTSESKYHPEPKAQLFELVFKQDRLLEIKPSKK